LAKKDPGEIGNSDLKLGGGGGGEGLRLPASGGARWLGETALDRVPTFYFAMGSTLWDGGWGSEAWRLGGVSNGGLSFVLLFCTEKYLVG